jgi:DHA2 family multidrug resistance protein
VIVLMPLVGALLSKVEARWLVVFGLIVSATGLFAMSRFDLQIDFRTAMDARVIQSMGMAFLFVPLNTIAFSSIAKEKANNATGLINLARNIGGSAGIATVTSVLSRRSQFHQSTLVSHVNSLNNAYRAMLEHTTHLFVSKGSDPVEAVRQAQALIYRLVQREAMMKAFIDDFRLLGMLFLAAIPIMLLIRKRQHS